MRQQQGYEFLLPAPAADALSLAVVPVPTRAELEAMDDGSGQLVYFIRCISSSDLVKIGVAGDVSDRLSCLQVGCPYELKLWGTLRGGLRAERALHTALARYRFRGEWFSTDALVRKAIRGLLNIDDQGRQR